VADRDQASGRFKHPREVGSAEIRHAEDAKAAYRIVTDGVHRDNVSVLETSQDLGLVAVGPRYLDGDEPPAQVDLLGEIDVGESASTQLQNDPEARQLVAGVR